MLRNQIYYRLKPLIPKSLRLGLRRFVAFKQRQRVGAVWPIQPGSETPPAGWPGWPDGKKFAFVLTHDVESCKGRDTCRELARIEMGLGFRSAFYFVPENSYDTPNELRRDLVRDGFEIGVHDLKHDGKLYFSRNRFDQHAERINEYLKNWEAVGFRSAFMHHNLEWLGALDTAYDASTFDTDPFEPQPDGVGTIFPFWVSGPNGRGGYIELPYTLPQDFTTFVILKERTLDLWKKKVDWIAAHGGMALVNVHPDYIRFDGGIPGVTEFPVAYYEEFLAWVKQKYGGQYFHALPRQIADYCRPLLAPRTAAAVQ
jgi:peptidoglycan/xylan/chitin deacetylase (PgdA/CDA1 family)